MLYIVYSGLSTGFTWTPSRPSHAEPRAKFSLSRSQTVPSARFALAAATLQPRSRATRAAHACPRSQPAARPLPFHISGMSLCPLMGKYMECDKSTLQAMSFEPLNGSENPHGRLIKILRTRQIHYQMLDCVSTFTLSLCPERCIEKAIQLDNLCKKL